MSMYGVKVKKRSVGKETSLLELVKSKDTKGVKEWESKAKKGKVMRIM